MASEATLRKLSFAKLIERATKLNIDTVTMTKQDLIIEIMAIETTPVIEIESSDEIDNVAAIVEIAAKVDKHLSSKKTMRSAIRHTLDTAIDAPTHESKRTLKSASGEIEITITALKGEIHFSTDDFATPDQYAFYSHIAVTLNLQ